VQIKQYAVFYGYYAVGLSLLGYGIRKNPFYRSYPIMLPIMVIAFVAMFIALFRKMRKFNTLVSDILLDPSGQELTFVFRNQFLRKLRNDKTEVTIPITSLINPP